MSKHDIVTITRRKQEKRLPPFSYDNYPSNQQREDKIFLRFATERGRTRY